MTNTTSPKSVTFDASALASALAASNPDLPSDVLHLILRGMIAGGQVELRAASTEDFPLTARIRLPVSGLPLARPAEDKAPISKAPEPLVGQIGQAPDSFEMLGPKAAAAAIGVSRSTLDNWRRAGLIIALPKGRSSHVIPTVQFVQSRPLPGVGELMTACDHDASLAWEYLTRPAPRQTRSIVEAAAAGDEEVIPALLQEIS